MKKLLLLVLFALLPFQSHAQSVIQVHTDYGTTPVTTAAYVQLIASTSAQIHSLSVFDSCGETMQLAIGAAGSEHQVLLIPPGGVGSPQPVVINPGQRVSMKALTGNCATSGDYSNINFFY